MTLQFFDTRVGALREFVPLCPGLVGIYVCGPTVQSSPHIGHLRSALVYDQMRRWLTFRGFDVTLVRNVTDIDDKILANATAARTQGSREEWWALAYRMEIEFTDAYRAIGVQPPTYEPRATASIAQMHELIQRLIDRGHAYVAPDGSGDVYFDVRSWPHYGELTRQSLDQVEASGDAVGRGKVDPADFALWKGHKPNEPESAAFSSPWGLGRPGWHLECSAMSHRYLGGEFDIHGGGLDLRFPHHENEWAQSRAAGDEFARYWVHNGIVTVNGQKMSKSLGNSVLAAEVLASASPLVVRYYLGSAHYRSTMDYHEGSLTEARAAVDRIVSMVARVDRESNGTPSSLERPNGAALPDAFARAMDDDLAIPQALAVVHDQVRQGHLALDEKDHQSARSHRDAVVAMLNVLGLNPATFPRTSSVSSNRDRALEVLVKRSLEQRDEARSSRDFATADRIRDTLAAAGVRIEDTPSGTHWSVDE